MHLIKIIIIILSNIYFICSFFEHSLLIIINKKLGSEDNTVRIWDAHKGSNLLILKGHSESIYSVAFSPDST